MSHLWEFLGCFWFVVLMVYAVFIHPYEPANVLVVAVAGAAIFCQLSAGGRTR